LGYSGAGKNLLDEVDTPTTTSVENKENTESAANVEIVISSSASAQKKGRVSTPSLF